jgi:hypothetical protein
MISNQKNFQFQNNNQMEQIDINENHNDGFAYNIENGQV